MFDQSKYNENMGKQKKAAEKREKASKGILIAVVVIFALVAIYGLCKAVFFNKYLEYDLIMLRGEWIDCMPPLLSERETELCEYAQDVGYPRIAY